MESTPAREFGGSASSSVGRWEFFGATRTQGTGAELPLVDAADAGSELCVPGELDEGLVAGKIVLCRRGELPPSDLDDIRAIDFVAKSEAVSEAGGLGMILYNQDDTQSLNAEDHSVPSVHINNSDGLVIKAYIASAGSGANAQINDGIPVLKENTPYLAAFSSRGPNQLAPDIIKPDITGELQSTQYH